MHTDTRSRASRFARLLPIITVVALLVLASTACGGSATGDSPSPATHTTSPSPLLTDEGSPTPDPTDGATPSVTASPSPTSGMSPEQQVLADYFAAVGPVYSRFMSQWWAAHHIVDVRAHDTMDQTWPIAARLLRKPLAKLEAVRSQYRTVVPVPAALITAHTKLGTCIESVYEFFSMARRGYVEGRDMDNDTAYGRKMTRLSKRSHASYDAWKQPVVDQAQELGVPIPWNWKESEAE